MLKESIHSQDLTAINRILDANLDRAREGLRIIEEWCRFGLNDGQLTAECKAMRQEIATWHSNKIRQARDTPGDRGTEITHPQEQSRTSIEQLLQVNLSRIQEALRVIEEYGKLETVSVSEAAKQMRYRTYTLESCLFGYQRYQRLEEATLYLVTSPQQQLLATVESALQAGLPIVQYRDKQADDTVKLAQAQQLKQLCDRYGALFLVNDRIDLALAVDADGVHLGQQDAPVSLARSLLGTGKIVGKSTTNPQELAKAIAAGADYVGVGPVYETPTKPGKSAAGFQYVSYAAQHCPIPWFAIGGIDASNLEAVIKAGASRVAVVRAIMAAEKPTLVTKHMLTQLQSFIQTPTNVPTNS